MESAAAWAVEEFGQAGLGNRLRTRRVVKMAAAVADAPGGLLSAVFRTTAERVGAYRFVENEGIDPAALVASSAAATIRRATGQQWLYVPLDGSSLRLADPVGRRGLGAVGSYKQGGRGLKTMSALGIGEDGTPCGLLDLQYWIRLKQPGRKARRHQQSIDEKETRFWLLALQRVEAVFARINASVRPWFQLDREGDFHELIALMSRMTNSRLTVRAAHNRRTAEGECGCLWDDLRARPPTARFKLRVAAGPKRQARQAHMTVRWAPVTLLLRDQRRNSRGRPTPATVWAVLSLEHGTVPPGEKPLQWLLLTNAPLADSQTAIQVIHAYSLRWRVEEFHRAWKSQCRVEDIHLHQLLPIQRWATLLAAVAMRIERLKILARTQPDAPADIELTREEIDAIIVLRQPAGYRRGDCPPIALAVRWLADLGGYIGPSNGPPGATVIGRGFQRVETAVITLRHLAQEKPD